MFILSKKPDSSIASLLSFQHSVISLQGLRHDTAAQIKVQIFLPTFGCSKLYPIVPQWGNIVKNEHVMRHESCL